MAELDPLQDIEILNHEDLTFGLPSKIFWGGVVLSLAIGFLFRAVWWASIPFAFIYFTSAYGIADPKAAPGWVRALRRAYSWSAGHTKGRRVCFLSEGD